MEPRDGRLTELVEHWQARAGGDVTDWPAFEACVLGDRALLRRAWSASDDAPAMLLVLCGLQVVDEDERAEPLARALSFSGPFARLAAAQARTPPGSNYNGPALFRFTRLAQAARLALREVPEAERGALGARLCTTLRALVPDPCALEDDGEPALASSRDSDRDRPTFDCGVEVELREHGGAVGRVRRITWNARFGCWTYWLEGDPRRWKAEDLR